MLTVIIPTRESERSLVQTLAPLVSGATAGLITEVIVADAGSHDATAEVADLAGCTYLVLDAAPGARLKQAAAAARTPWLMFLRPGTVPEPGWIEAVEAFIAAGETGERAGAFRRRSDEIEQPGLAAFLGTLKAALFGAPVGPEQGLLIARRFYDRLGGHPAMADGEAALLSRLGRRRIALLAAAARPPRPHT
jgi:glycosyltransferase involved in cell wall biosynthesis